MVLADIASLGELTEPRVTGNGVEKDGVGVEEVGGPGVGGLIDNDVSSIAAALRRWTWEHIFKRGSITGDEFETRGG